MTHKNKPTLGIVGGKGEMGRFFARFFRNKGFRVEVSDLGTPLTNRELIEISDIIIFSVPLHLAETIIEENVRYARPEQLLMDVSSLKEKPVKAMLKSGASVIGLHPMFGPQVPSVKGQTIIACPARVNDEVKREIYGLFNSSGARIKETSPEEHDKMMSIIQVLIHFSTIIMGRTLREMGVNIEESLDYTSPIYRLEMNFIGRLFAQDPALYGAIGMLNPHSEQVLGKLHESFTSYMDILKTKNLEEFIKDFKKTASFFGPYSPQAMKESGAILDFLINGKEKKDVGS